MSTAPTVYRIEMDWSWGSRGERTRSHIYVAGPVPLGHGPEHVLQALTFRDGPAADFARKVLATPLPHGYSLHPGLTMERIKVHQWRTA